MNAFTPRKTLTLRTTGETVLDADAATPRALRKTVPGYTRVIINLAGHKASFQLIKNSSLLRTVQHLPRSTTNAQAY